MKLSRSSWLLGLTVLSVLGSDLPSPAVAASGPEGLVAYYPLNGGLALDASGNSFDGVLVGVEPATDRHGNQDSASFFDGTVSRIDLPLELMAGDDWEDGFTVTWWQDADFTTELRAVWRLEEDKWIQAFYNERQFGQGLCVALFHAGTWNSVCDADPPSIWAHYAFTYDGHDMQLFRNSSLLDTDVSLGIEDTSFLNRISGVSQLLDADFIGRIDEFRIYDRPLGNAEIVTVFLDSLTCSGFLSPLDFFPVTVRKNRALPLKAVLADDSGNSVSGERILALPVLQVLFDPAGGGEAVDVTDEAFPAGQGTDGNQFVFSDGLWRFNLKTKNYSAAGTYTMTMVSGDESEYFVEGCSAQFVIDP